MSENGTEVTTPVGRCVWGSPTKPRPKKHQDGPTKGQPMIDALTGQPIMEISFGLAIPKAEFQAVVWPVMAAEIATGYPNGVPPRFSYKYQDGDGVDSEGKPFNIREGYAGHIVLTYTQRVNDTFGPPPVWKFNPQTNKFDQLGPDDVKCGDYFAVNTGFKVNVATGTHTPSIYVNPKGLELVWHGPAIVSAGAVDPNAAFGNRNYGAAPAGASAAPISSAPAGVGMPSAPAAPGGMPTPPPMGQVAPPAPPPPVPAPPVGPQRPTDPTHVHNNGNGTEQWLVNGAWDGGAHPIAAPAHDFVANAGYVTPGAVPMPGAPAAAGGMPGMPSPR